MQLETGATYPQPYRPPLLNLRWGAVGAGLVAGISAYLFLLLLGAAAGFALFDAGAQLNEEGLLIGTSLWNTLCMVACAVGGGYVAARAAGLRRTADGILHGLLAWGAAVLIAVLVATSAAGDALGKLFDDATNRPAATAATRPLDHDERQAIVDDFENRFGLDSAQANSLVDQLLALSGHDGSTNRDIEADRRQSLRAATLVSGWLSTAILASLLGAVGGGVLGCRSTRRVVAAAGGTRRPYTPYTVTLAPAPRPRRLRKMPRVTAGFRG